MKRIRIVGLCLMAVFALSAIAASSASAGELLFKAGTGNIVGGGFLSLGGLGLLITHKGKEIHCKEVHDHGKFLSTTLGDVLILFLGCTTKEGITVNCNTKGSPTGQIHLPLTTLFHLGLAQLDSTHGNIPAIVVLLGSSNVKIECTALATIEVLGAAIGALQKTNGEPVGLGEKLKEVNLTYAQTANGLQHLRLITMPGGALEVHDLDSNLNGGTFELSSEVAKATLDGFTNGAGAATEIELVEP